MSPRTGRPPNGNASKTLRFEMRLSEETAQQLQRCADKLGISKAEVVEKGIDLVDKTSKNE